MKREILDDKLEQANSVRRWYAEPRPEPSHLTPAPSPSPSPSPSPQPYPSPSPSPYPLFLTLALTLTRYAESRRELSEEKELELAEQREQAARYSGDIGEIEGRCRRDVGEM